MEKSRISIAYVGVLSPSKENLTFELDNKFCRDLFGQPYDTVNGMTPEGYVIRIGSRPFPLGVINPLKLIIKAESIDQLTEYISKLSLLFKDYKFIAYGINYEYETINMKEDPKKWLWEQFIKESISTPNDFHVCSGIKLSYGLNESELLNIDIEPRNGANGLFFSINHHHQIETKGLPSTDEIKDIIDTSYQCVEKDFFNNLM